MKWKTLIIWSVVLLFAMPLFADNHGVAEKFSYEYTTKPYWTKGSHYEDSYYLGSIIARCQLSARHGGGLKQMWTHLKDWFSERINKNHAKHPAGWQKQVGYFDYTDENGKKQKLTAWSVPIIAVDKDNKGEIKMKLMAYLAYKSNERLILYTELEEIIYAKGKKQRLKGFKNYFHFTKAKTRGYYNIYLWRDFKIEGYWYEPTFLFVKGAREETMETFTNYFAARFKGWSENL